MKQNGYNSLYIEPDISIHQETQKCNDQIGDKKIGKRPSKLLDQVRETIRLKHYSIRTEQTYVSWIKRYILFHNKRHPREMGVSEIEAFLTHLAVDRQVAASTVRRTSRRSHDQTFTG